MLEIVSTPVRERQQEALGDGTYFLYARAATMIYEARLPFKKGSTHEGRIALPDDQGVIDRNLSSP